MTDQSIRNLACAIIMQAVKDFIDADGMPAKQQVILKDLRSAHMDFITGGTSVIVAEQLEKHPVEIAARLRQYGDTKGELI